MSIDKVTSSFGEKDLNYRLFDSCIVPDEISMKTEYGEKNPYHKPLKNNSIGTSNSEKGLHLNMKDYWLKYNLQDSDFRNLLSLIFDVDKAILTQQLDGSVTIFCQDYL